MATASGGERRRGIGEEREGGRDEREDMGKGERNEGWKGKRRGTEWERRMRRDIEQIGQKA